MAQKLSNRCHRPYTPFRAVEEHFQENRCQRPTTPTNELVPLWLVHTAPQVLSHHEAYTRKTRVGGAQTQVETVQTNHILHRKMTRYVAEWALDSCVFPQKQGGKRSRHIMRQSLFSHYTRLVLVPGTIRAIAYWQKRAMIFDK